MAAAVTTPTGVAVFSEDVAVRRYAEQNNKIVHWSDFDRAGASPQWKLQTCWSATCVLSFAVSVDSRSG
jgi:hypothetical protein